MIRILRTFRTLSPVAASALLWMLTAGLSGIAHAETQASQPPQNEAGAAEVTDQQLQQFVEAATEVQTVQQQYAAEIQSTQEAEEAQSLRQEAQEKMVEAVEDAGLSVPEYNLIAQQLQQNPSLANRLNEMQSR